MGGAIITHGAEVRRIQGSDEEIWEKKPLRRPRCGWEDNTKMDWIDVAQVRDRLRALVIAVMNLRVP
jgi:hypothetical protein